MDTARPTPDNLESLAVTLASAVERQVTAYVGHASDATRTELRAEFEAALQQHHESVSVAMQAIVPEVQRLLNELNTQVLQRIDTTENRVTDRMLQLEDRINEQQGTRIANLEATIGRIGGGFDDAMQALSQRMLELENRLFATNDAIDAVRAKTEAFDDSVFTEVREQMSSAVGEAMLVRIELDRLAGTTDEKLDRTNLRMAEIEALLSDEMDVSAAVQLERLEEIEPLGSPPQYGSLQQALVVLGVRVRIPDNAAADPELHGARGAVHFPAAQVTAGRGSILHEADGGVAGGGAVAAHVHGDARGAVVVVEGDAVGEVLEVAEGLAVAADEAVGLSALHFEVEAAIVQLLLGDGGVGEAEVRQQVGEDGFGFVGHERGRVRVRRGRWGNDQ